MMILAVAAAACAFAAPDRDWTRDALEGWQRVNEARLGRAPVRPPTLILFDEACAHTLRSVAGGGGPGAFRAAGHTFGVSSVRHGGRVATPDGGQVPVGLTSFAAPDPAGGMFFVMSLPALWRARAAASDPDVLATVVFVHEFTHTQSAALGARIDALTARGLPADADDDVIQSRFGGRPGFRTAYEAERDLLFRAADAPTPRAAREAASAALRAIGERRRAYFTGADALYAEAEDVFLTMEGAAQWAAHAWLVDPRGGAMRPPDARAFLRRGGKRWSQDEGLALLLALDRLASDWPARVLEGADVVPLLAAAVSASPIPPRPQAPPPSAAPRPGSP